VLFCLSIFSFCFTFIYKKITNKNSKASSLSVVLQGQLDTWVVVGSQGHFVVKGFPVLPIERTGGGSYT